MKKKQEEAKEILRIKEEEAKKEIDNIVRIKKDWDRSQEEEKRNRRRTNSTDTNVDKKAEQAKKQMTSPELSKTQQPSPAQSLNNTMSALAISRMMGSTGMDPNAVGAMINTMLANQQKPTPPSKAASPSSSQK